MHTRERLIVGAACALVAMVVVTAGCRPATEKKTETRGGTRSRAATSTAEKPPSDALPQVATPGALVSPAAGDPVRAALMDAARARLGTSSKFVVLQIWSNGAWACAALRKESGGAVFVAYRNEVPGGWLAFWAAESGTGAADAIRAADKRFPPEILAKMDFVADLSRPTIAEAEAAILAIARKEYASIPTRSAKVEGVGRDSQGRWWFQGWTYAGDEYESEQWFVYYDGSNWVLHNYGTGTERTDEPADIVWQDVK